MHRRELLRVAAASAAIALLPRQARAAWARVAAPMATASFPLEMWTGDQEATLATLADAIIPRTDTPSATDVRVPAWIAVIMADYYTPTERAVVTDGLDAIDALAQQLSGRPFAVLTGEELTRVMTALDSATDRTTPAVRGYQRIKGLVVHGYFTSKVVQQQVLKTQIMPGRFVGDAPLRASTRSAPRDAQNSAHTHHEEHPHV